MNLEKPKKVLLFLSSFVYACFLFSGLMKWIPALPIDPTLFFGTICILVASYKAIFKKNKQDTYRVFTFLIGGALFAWILLACTHGFSKSYYQYKLLQTFLIFVALFYPTIVFRTEVYLKNFLNSVLVIGCIALILISILYNLANGDIFFYSNLANPEIFGDRALPDYLGIGDLLTSIVLVSQRKNNPFFLFIKFLCFMFLVWFSGRGPFFGLLLMLALDFVLTFKLNFKKIAFLGALFFLIPIALTYLYAWEGSEMMFGRIEAAQTGEDGAVVQRIEMFDAAIKGGIDNPLLGIGFGSFGKFFIDADERLYPHNMFLETFCETGLIGLFLLVSLILFYFIFPLRKMLMTEHFRNSLYAGIPLASISLLLQNLKASSICDIRLSFGFMGVVIAIYCILNTKTTNETLNS